ncbi:hypothetical protein LINGRAHAP2_LOCUS27984 [Linum grandiflorum]
MMTMKMLMKRRLMRMLLLLSNSERRFFHPLVLLRSGRVLLICHKIIPQDSRMVALLYLPKDSALTQTRTLHDACDRLVCLIFFFQVGGFSESCHPPIQKSKFVRLKSPKLNLELLLNFLN